MNKLFTKIVGTCLGLAMAVGTGVAVAAGASEEAVPVHATGETWASTSDTFELASSISAGDEIVIVSTYSDRAMGSQGSNNRSYGAVTKNTSVTPNTVKADAANSVAVFTVAVSTENSSYWTFYDGSGYLYDASTSSKNYLRTQSTVTSNGYSDWSVSITSGVASITARSASATSKLTMSYNTSGLFACYASLQTNGGLAIYKKVSKTLSSIAISDATTSYHVGDTFVKPTVTATYDDSSTADVTSSTTFSGYNMSVAGNYTVTASYTEGSTTKTATYSISVAAAAEPLSAEVTGDMNTKTYVEGSDYDVTGLIVTITYDDDSTRDFAMEDLEKNTDYILDHDTAVLGDTSLDISGEYLGCAFDVTVTGITVTAAPKIATYTIDSKTSVATTGLAPTGSSATYAQTYSTQGQATSGNTITLTISGFSKGTIINSIVMNMKSNSSAGAGGLTYSADSGANQTLIAAATNFNAWGDNSSYGTTYRDVTIGSNLNISVTTSFVLTLTASTNSLYVSSYTISYDYAAPTFTVAPTSHEIYTGENAASTVTVANFDTDPTLEYSVTSGASSISTVSISSYSSHVATVTITASSTAGTAVVRVRDSANPSTYYGDITVVVNEIPAYEIELSADSYAYVGDDVDVVVTTSRLQGTGINWSVISGSVDSESVTSDDTEYMATITSAGTLTIKATDNGNAENYATVSVTVVKALNAVNAPNVTNHSSELTFTGKYSEDGEQVDGEASDIWTVTSDGTESTWDSTNGIHFGTNSASVQYVQLSTSSIATGANDTIKSIVVNTQDRATTKGSLTVTVGGVNFKHEGSTSVTVTGGAADYAFTGNGTGEIIVKVDRGSAATKAIYVKSVTVNYVTENGASNIANAANMHLAQKAVIDYANDFNTALEAVCVAYGSTDTTDLENAWNDLADQYDNWFNNGDVDLTAEEIAHAKALFANADSVDRNKTASADDLQHMLAKYDWILSHYQLNDFLANDSGTNRPIVQNSSPRIGLFGNIDSSNATAIIVVVSLVSLTAIGGYFFIRKRKEQ